MDCFSVVELSMYSITSSSLSISNWRISGSKCWEGPVYAWNAGQPLPVKEDNTGLDGLRSWHCIATAQGSGLNNWWPWKHVGCVCGRLKLGTQPSNVQLSHHLWDLACFGLQGISVPVHLPAMKMFCHYGDFPCDWDNLCVISEAGGPYVEM